MDAVFRGAAHIVDRGGGFTRQLTGPLRGLFVQFLADQIFGGLGRQIVERAFERAGKKFTEAKLKAALTRLARASIDDVFIGVGRGEIFSTDVVRAVFPNFKEERKAGPAVPLNESGWFGLPKAADLVFRVPGESDAADALPLRGIDLDTPVRFAQKGAIPRARGTMRESSVAKATHSSTSASVSPGVPTIR